MGKVSVNYNSVSKDDYAMMVYSKADDKMKIYGNLLLEGDNELELGDVVLQYRCGEYGVYEVSEDGLQFYLGIGNRLSYIQMTILRGMLMYKEQNGKSSRLCDFTYGG